MEIDIEDYLKSEIAGPVSYIPNPGNAGDALIAAATYQVFDRLNIQYKLVRRDRSDYRGEFLIYGGGGNFGLMKNFSSRLLQRVHRTVARLVILPHTIKDVSPLLAEFSGNVHVICRERQSYEYVKSKVTQANVFLADDMALSLDVQKLLDKSATQPSLASMAVGYGMAKLHLNGRQPAPWSAIKGAQLIGPRISEMARVSAGDTLNAFRTDSERTSVAIPADNLDISELLSLGVENKEIAMLTSRHFLAFINNYKKIRTNRLHVCIGAALLGKQVEFFDNSYFKCRAVYEYSLRRFENVRYMGAADS